MSPEPSNPRPLIAVPAPWSAGIVTLVHAAPSLVLSHAASNEVPPLAPVLGAVLESTVPEITVALPRQVAYEMFSTVSPGLARPSWAAVIRCQVTPSRDVQITACVCLRPRRCSRPRGARARGGAAPAARKPSAVFVITHTESPGSCGLIPWVAARVQVRPVGLVQMACGPTATQPPGPPASSVAG